MSNKTYQILVVVSITLCGLVFIALIVILIVFCKRRQAKELKSIGVKIGFNERSTKTIDPVMAGIPDEENRPSENTITVN